MNSRQANVQRPKRHHYVPRFYLERFANPKHQVYLIDRTQQRGFTTGINNVTVESGFYDLTGPDGVRRSDAEEALSVLEADVKTLLDTIDHAEEAWEGPNDDERAVLSLFISMQFLRTKDARRAQEDLADIFIRAQLLASYGSASQGELRDRLRETGNREPTDREVEELRTSLEHLDEYTVLPSSNTLILRSFDHALKFVPLFAERPWTLLRARKKLFITSDRPVTLWRRPDDSRYGLGIASAEEIYFPLDSYSVLVLGSGEAGGWQVQQPTPVMARHLNRLVAGWSYRWIIHDPRHRPLEGESIPTIGPSGMAINGVPLRDKKRAWEVMRKALAPRREDS